jgi:hypothetical protein
MIGQKPRQIEPDRGFGPLGFRLCTNGRLSDCPATQQPYSQRKPPKPSPQRTLPHAGLLWVEGKNLGKVCPERKVSDSFVSSGQTSAGKSSLFVTF